MLPISLLRFSVGLVLCSSSLGAAALDLCQVEVVDPNDSDIVTVHHVTNCAYANSEATFDSLGGIAPTHLAPNESQVGVLGHQITQSNTSIAVTGTPYSTGAAATAAPGTLRAVATAHGEVFDNPGLTGVKASVSSSARGGFADELTITAPGVGIGASGVMHVPVAIDATLTANGASNIGGSINVFLHASSSSNVKSNADLGFFGLSGSFNVVGTGLLWDGGYTGVGGEVTILGFGSRDPAAHANHLSDTYLLAVNFLNGVPFTLTGEASADDTLTLTVPGTSADIAADFSHSLHWGGIQSVSFGGVDVPNYVATSLSGANYANNFAQPVPVPAMTRLFGIAVGMCARLRRNAQS